MTANIIDDAQPLAVIRATLVLMAEFKRAEFLALAQRKQITHAPMVPAMVGLCLLEPNLASFDIQAWRLGVYGSAPMPEPSIRRCAQALTLPPLASKPA